MWALALVLALIFPGLGHFALGFIKKGFLFAGLAVVSIILGIFGIGYIMYTIVWVCSIISTAYYGSHEERSDPKS